VTKIARTVALALMALSASLAAQQPAVVSPPFDSTARAELLRLLPDSLRIRGQALLNTSDPRARLSQVASLAGQTGAVAAPFLLALAERDPAPLVRTAVARQVPFLPALMGHPSTIPVLERLAAADPSVDVSLAALESLRTIRMTATGELLVRRLAAARTVSDSAGIRRLMDEEERWISLRGGRMLPAFLRRVPPVFQARPDSASLVRVLAFGDFGTGDTTQLQTAAAMRAYHRTSRFDFAITLGDNFYPVGMLATDDPRWQSQYEALYTPLGIPFYATMGNHDWGHPDSPAAEILYSGLSKSWRMPAPYYTFTAGPVQFFAIDTQEMSSAQLAWLDRAISESKATWKVVYGHHQAYSATRLDNPRLINSLVPLMNHRVDVYLCGHDHNLQALRPVNGVHYFVAGAGGAGTYRTDSTYARALARFETYGFAVLEATRTTLTVRLVDQGRKELYVTTLRK
jgi:tartrate-resistant acid phosphatase type 5